VAATETPAAGLAGRYATALFDLADEARALDTVAADLGRIKAMIEGSDELRRLIASPLISRAQQAQAIAALLDRAQVGDLTRRFVLIVARNRRLHALTQIIAAYVAALAARRGEVTAEIRSARPLSSAQVDAVTGVIQRSAGAKVRVDLKVEPGLLGGLVVRLGSRLIDASLRSKLQRLQLAMKGTA